MRYLLTALLGLTMGFGLSRIGFADYAELHRMFVLEDFRLVFTFMGAVGVLFAGLALIGGRRRFNSRRVTKGTVAGGLLFGLGWVLSGACPAIALVQLGEGKLFAAVTLLGIVAGTWAYPKVHARWFRWAPGSCE